MNTTENSVDDNILNSPKKWREENGVIYFKVTGDCLTGGKWIERLKKQGINIERDARELLWSDYFQTIKDFKFSKWIKELILPKRLKSNNRIVYEIAVLKGSLFTDNNRTFPEILNKARRRGFLIPEPEVACLIRENFSNQEIEAMGIYFIATMHRTLRTHFGMPAILITFSISDTHDSLDISYTYSDSLWNDGFGFAFEVSHRPA